MANSETLTIIEADIVNGNILVYFSNGQSALFKAHFLWDVRHDDGNAVSPAGDPEDEGPMKRAEEA